MQRHLGQPVLAVVPYTKEPPAEKGAKKTTAGHEKFPKGLFLANYLPNSRFSEAYRTLRTNLSFRHLEKEHRSLLVTSAVPLEGKTLTTANLAFVLSQTGKSVLMIDADLRKPKLSYLSCPAESSGLTGLLTDAFNMPLNKGDISGALSVSDLFRLATLQKKTGVLHIRGDDEKVDLVFLQGSLVDVEWKTRPDDKKLASILVDNAKITKEQAQKAIIKQRDTGQKLGFILINMGFLPEEDLKGPLTIHMMEGLRTALQVEKGRFTFTDSSPMNTINCASTRSMHTTCTTRCCSETKRCRLFKTASIPRYCPPKQRTCFCCPAVKYPPTRPNCWVHGGWHS